VASAQVALVGDASCSVDGIAGHGLSLGLQQARALADALSRGDLRSYRSAHRRIVSMPLRMTRLLLLMDASTWVRRKTLRLFENQPELFAKIISVHTSRPQDEAFDIKKCLISWRSPGVRMNFVLWFLRIKIRPALSTVAFIVTLFAAPHTHAQGSVFTVDPSKSTVEFTLGASLHTVHGTFKLKSGEIHFDPAKGTASGAIVVDALSGESGNEGRDKKMHQEILETPSWRRFVPSRVRNNHTGHFRSPSQRHETSRNHEMTLNFAVQ
jgi:hypothetical protein